MGAYFGVLTREGAMNVRRLIACILLPCYLVACMSWKTQDASPQQVIAEEPDKVRVTLTDGSQVEVFQPVVSGDTLIGLQDWKSSGDSLRTEVSIPLTDVSAIEVRETDTEWTILAVFGGLVVVAAIALNVAVAIYCDSPIGC